MSSDLRNFSGRGEWTEMLHADRAVSLNGGKQNFTKMTKGFRCCGPTTGWTTEGSGIYSRQGQWIFICSKAARPAVGLNPSPVQRVAGALALRRKRAGRGADHPHRVQWLRMDGTVSWLADMTLLHARGLLYLGEGGLNSV
jgi:hypothetical protein